MTQPCHTLQIRHASGACTPGNAWTSGCSRAPDTLKHSMIAVDMPILSGNTQDYTSPLLDPQQ